MKILGILLYQELMSRPCGGKECIMQEREMYLATEL